MIQKSGIGDMSVEKYVVTPSIKLEGTNDSAIHISFCLVEMVLLSNKLVELFDNSELPEAGKNQNTPAQAAMRTSNKQ